jgi:hypothetical protein
MRETLWKINLNPVKDVSMIYTGRFIMFSVITNIYNNNNCSQPQENGKSFFLTTRDFLCVHHG